MNSSKRNGSILYWIKKASLILIQGLFLLSFNSLQELHAQCGSLQVLVESDPVPPFNLCPGETILLTSIVTGGTAPYTYLWSDGTTNSTSIIIPPYQGQAYVQVTDAIGCVAWGQIHIKAWVWTVDIIYTGFTVCQGDSMPLHAYPDFPAGTTFLWSTGETTSPIYITNSGTYSLTATAPGGGCTASVTEFVGMFFFPIPEPIIAGPSVLCTGQNATLSVTDPGSYSGFIWSTGDVTSTIVISDPGIYSVTATNWDGCIGADTVEVLPGTDPPDLTAPSVLCNGQSGTVSVTNAGSYTSFLWSTGATTSSITINSAGTYSVTVTAPGGCTSTGSVTVATGNSNMAINGSATAMTSCTNPNGSINITVTPTGSYSYNWSNGATTEDINNLAAGNYTVTVTDSGGCIASSSFTVSSNLVIPTLNTNATSSTCNLSNGSVDLSVNPAGTYNFLWSNGNTIEDLSNVTAGTYFVTVTSSNGCTATASAIVPNFNPVINVTGNTTPFTNCALPNGAIDITASPAGAYTYTWSNGSTAEDLINLFSGNYTVTVSAGGTCNATASFTVPNNTTPPVPVANTSSDTCGQSVGDIDLSVTPLESYTYLWSNGSTTEDLINISAGIYTVTVTSTVSSCNAVLADTVTNYAPVIIVNGTPTASTCGQSNGSIDLDISPLGSYTFIWSTGNTSEDLSNIPAGNYSVTVTSSDGCTNTASIIVPDNPIPIIIAGITTPNTSCTNENGSIDITLSPTGTYSYIWSNGATSQDLSNVSAGSYTVTATLGLTCVGVQSFEVTESVDPVFVSGTTTPNTSCSQPNGAIDITVSTSGSPTFLWSNNETTEDLQQLTGGMYSVTVAGDNGCTATEIFEIINTSSNFSITGITIPNTSCISPNGQVDLTVTPSGSYSFIWTTGATSEDLQNIAAGLYGVTITDANNCALVEVFVVEDNTIYPVIMPQIIPSICGGNNGSIDLTVSPATGNSFLWSNGEVVDDIFNLVAGDYTVTVTDTNGCITADSFAVGNQNNNFTITGVTQPNNSCTIFNGSISITVAPAGSYSFTWSNGATTEDLQGISAGMYAITVMDDLNCMTSDTFEVLDNTSLPVLSAVTTPNSSCQVSNGSIDLSIAPVGTYNFAWSNGAATEDIAILGAGFYTVTVTDITSCSSMATFEVLSSVSPVTMSAVITPSACGLNTGAIDISTNPSNGNTFTWSNGASTEDLQSLGVGNYILTVTGSNGCTTTDTFNVSDIGSNIILSGITSPNTNCVVPNGRIDLSFSPTGSYSFAWSNGISSEDQADLAPGTYTVTVSDNNGCSSSMEFVILDQRVLPVISGNVTPSVCGDNNGQINITITPVGIYTISWSNGSAVEDLQDIMAGNYTVTVTSEEGCPANSDFIVPNTNSNFSISGIAAGNTYCEGANGSIDITMMPSGTYNFAWSNGAVTEDLLNLQPGNYSLTVTDLSGCASIEMFIVDDLVEQLVVTPAISPALCGESNGSIHLDVTPSDGNIFIWSNGQSTEDLEELLPGTYSVTITAQSGCTWSSVFTLPVSENVSVNIQADLTGAQGDSTTITTDVNIDIDAIETIMWFPAALFSCAQNKCLQQIILTPDQPTEIMIMVIDTNGCMGEAMLMLRAAIDPDVFIPNVFTPNNDGFNDRFTVYGNEDVELIVELQIFDRWGNQVFVNTDFPPNEENVGWDGIFKDQLMNPAVFAYWARVRFTNGEEARYLGDVTLLR